jgi:hypothetical protein
MEAAMKTLVTALVVVVLEAGFLLSVAALPSPDAAPGALAAARPAPVVAAR